MSLKTITTVTCDICGCEIGQFDQSKQEPPKPISVLVWFDTEQTEGRSVTPYLSNESLHLCDDCADKGIMIHAVGAMGFNEYSIKGEKTCKLEKCSWDDGQCTWGVRCTACGHKHEHETGDCWNNCPNCGAEVKR